METEGIPQSYLLVGQSRIFLLLVLVFACEPIQAALSQQEAQAIAHRFRPYIKTSDKCVLAGCAEEPHHPCNWQWFVGHSSVVTNYSQETDPACGGEGIDDTWPNGMVLRTSNEMSQDPAALIQLPRSDVRPMNGAADYKYALHLDTAEAHGGENWSEVIFSGHGIYAHVEEVPSTASRMVNIEYSILWAYNSALCNYHHGDITTIVVVYDRGSDLLTRLTFVIHGKVIEAFRVAQPNPISLTLLHGRDLNNTPTSIRAAKLRISGADKYQDGPSWHDPSEPEVFLAEDPSSLRYEHPVVYAEYGAHELWPNPTGAASTAPAHPGDGVSFLPSRVQLLGTLTEPVSEHEPFLFYNGKFGTDPMGIIFHGTWFWTAGRSDNPYGITEARFTDRSPYEQHGNLPWPPLPEFVGGPVTVYADWRAAASFDGSLGSPFPDPMTANSFVPSRGVISVAAGTYPRRAVFSRACTLIARNGLVTLGR